MSNYFCNFARDFFNKENSLLSVSKSIKGKRDREAYST